MPTASQISAYNMGMTSASTGSQIITERCHDSNMNNTNPVSIKEKSDWKESREHCSTAEWIDTSGEIGSSAYSMDERLWMTTIDWGQLWTGVWTMRSVIIGHSMVKA
jgi:hypothetical protein